MSLSVRKDVIRRVNADEMVVVADFMSCHQTALMSCL